MWDSLFENSKFISSAVTNKIRSYESYIQKWYEDKFLESIFYHYIQNNDRANKVMGIKAENYHELLGERDIPSDEKFIKNGWWRIMLLRYGLAMHYSKGKEVLDTCSGMGWGAYLISSNASHVTCIELEKKSIGISKKIWESDNIEWVCGSVLKMPYCNDRYDIVTAMESIEHFKLEDIRVYIREVYRVLKPGGYFIGSSCFPETIEEANYMLSKNKFHLHICTKNEIIELLEEQGFRDIKIFHNRLFFIAKKV